MNNLPFWWIISYSQNSSTGVVVRFFFVTLWWCSMYSLNVWFVGSALKHVSVFHQPSATEFEIKYLWKSWKIHELSKSLICQTSNNQNNLAIFYTSKLPQKTNLELRSQNWKVAQKCHWPTSLLLCFGFDYYQTFQKVDNLELWKETKTKQQST